MVLTEALQFTTPEEALQKIRGVMSHAGKVVLDVDDTVLYVKGNHIARVECMYEFYKHLVAMGCEVFFVTARPNNLRNRSATRNMLERLGFHCIAGLFLMTRPRHETHGKAFEQEVAGFKAKTRERIGYPILLNIGNRWQDIVKPSIALHDDDQTVFLFRGVQEDVELCVKLPRKVQTPKPKPCPSPKPLSGAPLLAEPKEA